MSFQNDIEHLKDLMQRDQLTAAQANVELVRIKRFRLITSKMPQDVRKALNEAVRNGEPLTNFYQPSNTSPVAPGR